MSESSGRANEREWLASQGEYDEAIPMDRKKKYAEVCWTWKDIKSMRPKWNKERCEEFLERKGKYVADAMVQAGWQAIGDLLD